MIIECSGRYEHELFHKETQVSSHVASEVVVKVTRYVSDGPEAFPAKTATDVVVAGSAAVQHWQPAGPVSTYLQ